MVNVFPDIIHSLLSHSAVFSLENTKVELRFFMVCMHECLSKI